MGDRGGNKGYVVQPGDSYEKIAGKLYGNQRAFGDLIKARLADRPMLVIVRVLHGLLRVAFKR